MKAALFTKTGKMVTGSFHGEAFGKLSACEKEQEIISGFFDSVTGQFVSDEINFFVKKIVLIRHADVENNLDNPGITSYGRQQTAKLAGYIIEAIKDIREYEAYCSPLKRCVETSQVISNETGLKFTIKSEFRERCANESAQEFVQRIKQIVSSLSRRTIVISHCNLILNVVQLASGKVDHPIFNNGLPKSSVTFVDNHDIVWFGKVA